MKKWYRIPVIYEMTGFVDVPADTLQEAKENARMKQELPKSPKYVDRSIKIDETFTHIIVYDTDTIE
jgi:hypothetical protein